MKPKAAKPEDLQDRDTHAAGENRFSDDMMLRAAGFVIVSRPEDGLPVWRRGGKTYTQPVAVRVMAEAAYREKGGR